MKRQSVLIAAVMFMIAGMLTTQSDAQIKLPFKKRVSSDPSLNMSLSERNGPWLILCASFVGERGEQQARQLALELRRDHNLETYLYRHRFDYSNTVAGLGWEPYTTSTGEHQIRPMRMKAAHADSFEEIAVLVGNFSDIEDNKAQKTLETIKYLKPRALAVNPETVTNQRFGVWREIQRRVSLEPELKEKGPMRAAFMMQNPILPPEYFVNRQVDKLVVKLNDGVRNSLLDCPGRYTVRVATFRGQSTFNAMEINAAQMDIDRRKKTGEPVRDSKLVDAAEKAHVLCQELRRLGVEAYEFHDRFESSVCVGSFDWATRKMANGKDELNPAVAAVIKEYKATTHSIPGVQQVIRPRTLKSLRGKKINFDPQPLPVIVPRYNVR